MSNKTDPKHWYLLAFQVQHPGAWIPLSIMHATTDMQLTLVELQLAKHAHNVPEASVLTSVSYLGYCTENAMNGKPDIEPPTELTPAFQQGMRAAMDNETNLSANPYMGAGDAAGQHKANEWAKGYQTIRQAQADQATANKADSLALDTATEAAKPENQQVKPVRNK